MNIKYLAITVASSISICAANAYAATETGTMGVSATVVRTCTVTSTPLAFGTLNNAANNDASSTVTVTCTAGSSTDTPRVTFSSGAHAGTGGQRQMRGGDSGNAFLPYGLFSDVGRANSLLSTTPVDLSTSNNGVAYNVDVYGRVPAGTYEKGNFSDSVTITLTYAAQ